MIAGALSIVHEHWRRVSAGDAIARALADQHYSRQTIGSVQFAPSGRKLVLLTYDNGALWVAVQNRDVTGAERWRVTIFRREHGAQASALIVEATTRTREFWRAHYGAEPRVPLTTEVDPSRVRRKRDPGRCFLRAGWTRIADRPAGHGRPLLAIFEAPST